MNYICQTTTPKLSSRFISKIKVPEGGLTPGSIIVADTLDNTILGNYEVYTAATPATANLKSGFLALVANDGFETLDDGRRPAGQPNYYEYKFKEGDIAKIIYLGKHLKFNIGADSIAENTKNLAIVGNYLIPVNGSTTLNASATIPSANGTVLKILSVYNTPIGGLYGGGFALSYICTPVEADAVAPAKYDLTVNQGEGTTLTIKRGEEVLQAGTGVLNAGDTLNITVDPESASLKINGEDYAHEVTYTVTGNTVVVSAVNGG